MIMINKTYKKVVALAIVQAILFIGMISFSAAATTKPKTPGVSSVAAPQPVISSLAPSYNKNEKINFKVFSVDYSGKVQYKVALSKIGSSSVVDITKGYSKAMSASAIFNVSIPEQYFDGKYKLMVYAKAANSKIVSYHTDSKQFGISKDIILSKNGQVLDLAKLASQLTGNIYVQADNVSIKNVKLNGSVIVAADKTGSLSISNTTAANIEVKANGIGKLSLANAKIAKLTISKGANGTIRIAALNNTAIAYANIGSGVKFDLSSGANVLKFDDKDKASNLAYNNDGIAVTSDQSANDQTASVDNSTVIEDNQTPGGAADIKASDSSAPVVAATTTSSDKSTTTSAAVVSKPAETPAVDTKPDTTAATTLSSKAADTTVTKPANETPTASGGSASAGGSSAVTGGSGATGGSSVVAGGSGAAGGSPSAAGGSASAGGSSAAGGDSTPQNSTPAVKPLTVEFAGIELNGPDTTVAFTGSDNNYSMDLSTESQTTSVVYLCIQVSKDATLTINRIDFALKADTMKKIQVLTDFGYTDNGPPGATMASIRSNPLVASALSSYSGELKDEVNTTIEIKMHIKVK